MLIIDAVTATRRTMHIAGTVVPVTNVPPSMAPEAGQILLVAHALELSILAEVNLGGIRYDANGMGRIEDATEEAFAGANLPPFAATYYDGADGRRHFSLHSPPGGADVGRLAQQMAARFNSLAKSPLSDALGRDLGDNPYTRGKPWSSAGDAHAAVFDAPLGWEGEQ